MTKNGAFPPDFYMFRQSLFLLHSPNKQISIAALIVENIAIFISKSIHY